MLPGRLPGSCVPLNLQVLVIDVVSGPPSWKLPSPVLSFILKCDPLPLQLQLALEHTHITSTRIDHYNRMVPLMVLPSDLTCRCLLGVASVIGFVSSPIPRCMS
ncbi:hypothetical protein E2C01_023483 [Portunus trituberculatus]|uniref:Uncharacterized protein n=1 Tax=Portunus trituberculatus TaxID=210409 RepID=A0A5B7EB89_PORTR|nr:hypothetical protein [Portunus trituberculatus]